MNSLEFKLEDNDKLQGQAKKLIHTKQFDSIEWQLMQHGKVLSRGSESIDSKSESNEQPIYRIYSMTKPIVSFVALQLVDEGKLALSDLLSQYIPAMASLQVLNAKGELEALQTPITIKHLLTHTAGFSYDFLPDCAVATSYRGVSLSGDASRSLTEVMALLTTMPLAYQPGEQWRYSVATDVLAHVLENVTGLDLPELLYTRVFEPLGMGDTAFFVPEEKKQRVLPMFGARELGQVMVDSTEPNELTALDVNASYPLGQLNQSQSSQFYRGGHGLYSTMDDYIKFMHVLETGCSQNAKVLVSDNALNLLWQDNVNSKLHPLVLGYTVMGGYSWSLMGRTMVDPEQCVVNTSDGEGGWSGAASTYFWIDRKNGISGIAMSQYIGSTQALGPLMQHAAYGMFKPST